MIYFNVGWNKFIKFYIQNDGIPTELLQELQSNDCSTVNIKRDYFPIAGYVTNFRNNASVPLPLKI